VTDLPATGHAVDRGAVVPRLEKLRDRMLRRRGVRHVVVGAADVDGRWSWGDAAGEANPDGAPMRVDTPWFLASVTKLYIAAVVLRLTEERSVELDAPVRDYLPARLRTGLHVIDGVDTTDRITVRHLLGHLTGLPDSVDERPRGGRSLVEEVLEGADRAWSFEDAVGRARDRLTPHFPPSNPAGRRPRIRYSDTNFQLLMVIAEHVTGRPMAELYRELLFGPLDLNQTWLPGDPAAERAAGPATVWIGDRALEDRPLAMRSFGDLYGTVDDVLRFGRALFTGSVFAAPATAGLMWESFHRFGFPRGMAALRAPSWPIEYGLGMMRFALSRWLTSGLRIPGLIGHTGSTGSWLWYCPELRLLLAGTVDQTGAATVPFRLVPRALAGLA
jgi:CubicO group peptidase (beta-lactamase class C family)